MFISDMEIPRSVIGLATADRMSVKVATFFCFNAVRFLDFRNKSNLYEKDPDFSYGVKVAWDEDSR
jgi:hypothetical protein